MILNTVSSVCGWEIKKAELAVLTAGRECVTLPTGEQDDTNQSGLTVSSASWRLAFLKYLVETCVTLYPSWLVDIVQHQKTKPES